MAVKLEQPESSFKIVENSLDNNNAMLAVTESVRSFPQDTCFGVVAYIRQCYIFAVLSNVLTGISPKTDKMGVLFMRKLLQINFRTLKHFCFISILH